MDARVLLLLLLGMCLWPAFVQALTCHECPRLNEAGVCETETSTCEATGNQQCFLRKIYEGGRMQYAQQGCSSLCISLDFFRPTAEVDLSCCKSSSFCNRF